MSNNINESNLFDNHMVRQALSAMTPEQVEEYKRIGEKMYNTIDFNDGKVIQEMEPPFSEAVAYIEMGLTSGLLPTDLEDNDIQVMEEVYGKEWYKKYGFTHDDLPEKYRLKYEIKNVGANLQNNKNNKNNN
jgi:hypothetical protein